MSAFAPSLWADNSGLPGHGTVPSFVPTTKPYRVLPVVSRSAICACNRCTCSIP